MTIPEAITSLIKNEIQKEEVYVKVGKASSIILGEKIFTFIPDDGSAPVEKVRLKSIQTTTGGSFVIIPEEGSYVVIAFINSVDAICLHVEVAQSITLDSPTFTINGGENGGLININPLTEKLNSLVSSVNAFISIFTSHTHSGVQTGGGTTAPPASAPSNAQNFNASDYLDDKVLH
jgi:hypothetical protein